MRTREVAHQLAMCIGPYHLGLRREVVLGHAPQRVRLALPAGEALRLRVLADRGLAQDLLGGGSCLLGAELIRRADQHAAGAAMGPVLRDVRLADPVAAEPDSQP